MIRISHVFTGVSAAGAELELRTAVCFPQGVDSQYAALMIYAPSTEDRRAYYWRWPEGLSFKKLFEDGLTQPLVLFNGLGSYVGELPRPPDHLLDEYEDSPANELVQACIAWYSAQTCVQAALTVGSNCWLGPSIN